MACVLFLQRPCSQQWEVDTRADIGAVPAIANGVQPHQTAAALNTSVAMAGIESVTFRFSDGLALGLNLFALVKLDTRPTFRRVRSAGPARWPHLGPIR
jgi:hypothetical protein